MSNIVHVDVLIIVKPVLQIYYGCPGLSWTETSISWTSRFVVPDC